MLTYLVNVTTDLIAVAVLCGLLYAYVNRYYDHTGRLFQHIGMVVGLLASIVMAVMKNKTSLVHTGIWNMRIFIATTALFLILLVLAIPAIRKKLNGAGTVIVSIVAGLITALLLFYELPDFLAYPFVFRKLYGGGTVFSTEFLYRFIGYVLGFLLCLISFFAARFMAQKSEAGAATALTMLALGVNAFQQVGKTLSTMLTRRMIPNNHTLFLFVKFFSNHANLFVFLILGCAAVLAVLQWVRSLHVREPYDNPAQHRRIRATWRTRRRWAALMLVCCLCAVLVLTVGYNILHAPPVLAEAEEYTLENGNAYVSLAQVEDGHLHRFAYISENNVEVRFIVIKKPNSSAYGIGLDACEICGSTGYYERGNQVVCNRCDVVMNINTIGFKGGCNPIPIDYSIDEGYIVIPASTLEEHEKDFK